MSSISVLMSIYIKDSPKFLNDALNSITDIQTLEPKEIILIQDGKLTIELDHIVKKWKKKSSTVLQIVN